MTLLMLRGIRRLWRQNRSAVLPYLALIGIFPLTYYITHPLMDYSQPIAPAIVVMAVAGALPLSYGGFGAREITALIAFPLVGLPAEAGLAASALYGIVAIVLGLAAAPSFSLRYQP